MDDIVLKEVYKRCEKNEKIALITLTKSSGSTPRNAGSMMALFSDGTSVGSIGGGKLEYEVLKEAKECLENNKSKIFNHELTPNGDLKMQCGGLASGYIKIINQKPKLIIFGAGHIGKEIIFLAKYLGFYSILLDDRKEYLKNYADEEHLSNYEDLDFLEIDENTYIIIVTKSHLDDYKCLKSVIEKNAKYIGVIGSKTKHKFIKDELIKDSFSNELFHKIYAPIGLDIANQEPREIAFSILSEILLIKNQGNLAHKKSF
ncbi:XdhC family protein [Campylobacter sp. Cr9]|uniref:XdhC family protein n=1 Tax=Campylobacter sp. Cr9 TaxID=2735728 RepID=UPI003014A046|nr:XdhC family protein [Campylobacter sp. Cr9]